MKQVFIHILNNSHTVSILIVAILIVRMLFRKMPKWISCLLWITVAIKLVSPIQITSAFGVISYDKSTLSGIITEGKSISNQNQGSMSGNIGMIVWLLGVIIMIGYACITFIMLKKKVRASIRYEKNVYECDDIQGAFILGIIHPQIYISSTLLDKEKGYILKHERAHIKRKDYIWKPLGFIILVVYWFQPLCWIAYILLCRDIECACDEKATARDKAGERADYCQVLLAYGIQIHMITACPVAFGENGIKRRVKNILNYKKPTFYITAVSIIICIMVSLCFATNKKNLNKTIRQEEQLEMMNSSVVVIYDDESEKQVLSGKWLGDMYETIDVIIGTNESCCYKNESFDMTYYRYED